MHSGRIGDARMDPGSWESVASLIDLIVNTRMARYTDQEWYAFGS